RQPAILPDGVTFTPDEQGRVDGSILERLDGLILSGGGDVHPSYFGEEMDGTAEESVDRMRDELELTLARQALARDMPLFGICRGCQALNIAAGGKLVQDLPNHRSPTEDPWLHGVAVSGESRLHRILGSQRLEVNTYHHQGINQAKLAPGFLPSALA
ncbi:gamma-glutamyl-gamma-aminobutyrate hydrolase family protein, partial [Arthrospira platensis SPKY2]